MLFNRNRVMHDIVFMLIPGVPSSPTNITLIENGVNSLRVEWSSPIIGGVNLQFILTVTYLNSSISQPLVIPNITTQHYNFTMEGDHVMSILSKSQHSMVLEPVILVR